MKKILSITNIVTRFAGVVLVVFALTAALMAMPVSAATAKDAVCEGAGLIADGGGCGAPAGSPDVNTTVARGLNLFSAIIGVIAVVMIMIGGLKYMTSQGDSSQMNSAKNTLIFAAVGLAIVALAQLLVNFVIERFTR